MGTLSGRLGLGRRPRFFFFCGGCCASSSAVATQRTQTVEWEVAHANKTRKRVRPFPGLWAVAPKERGGVGRGTRGQSGDGGGGVCGQACQLAGWGRGQGGQTAGDGLEVARIVLSGLEGLLLDGLCPRSRLSWELNEQPRTAKKLKR